MRKALVSLAGALGLVALYRALRSRTTAADTPPAAAADDPAEELRAAIADVKASDGEAVPDTEDDPASPEERRRRVHERAQEAIDAMRDEPTHS